MKRAFLMLLALTVLAGLSGCCCPHGQGLTSCLCGSCSDAPESCGSCSSDCDSCVDGCDGCDGGSAGLDGLMGMDGYCPGCGGQGCQRCCGRFREPATPGPATGAITYPYYTVRGPRDFLARSPRSIGP